MSKPWQSGPLAITNWLSRPCKSVSSVFCFLSSVYTTIQPSQHTRYSFVSLQLFQAPPLLAKSHCHKSNNFLRNVYIHYTCTPFNGRSLGKRAKGFEMKFLQARCPPCRPINRVKELKNDNVLDWREHAAKVTKVSWGTLWWLPRLLCPPTSRELEVYK